MKPGSIQYEAMVFDMDGVIFDSERAVIGCWIELAEKYGFQDIEKACLACTGTTMARTREIMLEIYGQDFHMINMPKKHRLCTMRNTMVADCR